MQNFHTGFLSFRLDEFPCLLATVSPEELPLQRQQQHSFRRKRPVQAVGKYARYQLL